MVERVVGWQRCDRELGRGDSSQSGDGKEACWLVTAAGGSCLGVAAHQGRVGYQYVWVVYSDSEGC